MATYWVDNVSGSDGNPGTSFGAAKASWAAGLALLTTVGDTLNIVDTGTPYEATANGLVGGGTALAGTSEVSFGARIRGVAGSDESPAVVEVKFGAAIDFVEVRNSQAYVLVQGFYVNRANTTFTGSNASLHFAALNDIGAGTAGPIIISRCHDFSTASLRGSFLRIKSPAGNQNQAEVKYNFIENWHVECVNVPASQPGRVLQVHHNVFYQNDATTEQAVTAITSDTNATDWFVHNTVIHRNAVMDLLTYTAGSANASSVKMIHSNVIFDDSAVGGSRFFARGNVAFEDDVPAWPGTRTIGYNIFINPGGHTWGTDQPYQVPWDFDASDAPDDTGEVWDTDVVDEAADADPFNDLDTPWDWVVDGYTITLPGDLRLTEHRSSGLSGAVPGAIPDTIGVPSEPPIFDPGPSGLPVGPNNPAFMFEGPDGINAALHLRRNTVLEGHHYFTGEQESVTRVGDGMAIVGTNVADAALNLLAGSRAFMLEVDAPVTIKLNNRSIPLLAGGCILIDGASLNTLTVTNPSTIRRANVRYLGAK